MLANPVHRISFEKPKVQYFNFCRNEIRKDFLIL